MFRIYGKDPAVNPAVAEFEPALAVRRSRLHHLPREDPPGLHYRLRHGDRYFFGKRAEGAEVRLLRRKHLRRLLWRGAEQNRLDHSRDRKNGRGPRSPLLISA